MSEGFTKLFSSILRSTIWQEPAETKVVWITMLAMCDRNGYVGASIPGVAAAAGVSVQAVEEAVAKFLAPDKYSRSTEHEGRRIAVAERGWTILNYKKFREMRDQEARREWDRERKRAERSGQSEVSAECPPESAHADAEMQMHSKQRTGKHAARAVVPTERPDDVPADLWDEWLAFRRRKNAPVTQRVLDSTRKTATEAGMTMAEAFTYWVANGQTGFFPPKGKPALRQTGAVVSGLRVVHPANMPVPYDSPIDPCHCGACVGARKRKEVCQ